MISERGLRINRVNSLGAELVLLREKRQALRSKLRQKHKASQREILLQEKKDLQRIIVHQMADIIESGGEFDEQGLIHMAPEDCFNV